MPQQFNSKEHSDDADRHEIVGTASSGLNLEIFAASRAEKTSILFVGR